MFAKFLEDHAFLSFNIVDPGIDVSDPRQSPIPFLLPTSFFHLEAAYFQIAQVRDPAGVNPPGVGANISNTSNIL
jgi:hypothetical protein